MGYLKDQGLFVKLVCKEKDPKRVYHNFMDMVCEDSAMEVFLAFPEKGEALTNDVMYLNFEVNSNGAMYAAYGKGRKGRKPMPEKYLQVVDCKADRQEDSWTLTYLIPESYLKEEAGVEIPLHHCSNSAGIIRMPEANLNIVRAGITIYGIYPSSEVERDIVKLEPVMELKSHVTYVKDVPAGAAISYGGTYVADRKLRVATVPVGYADGYSRQLSNKGWVLIHGQKAPILGRVCMDQFMVDVTEIGDVKKGDEVTLIGRDGDEFIGIEEIGDLCGRFSYEFACDISPRVPRVYIKNGKEI